MKKLSKFSFSSLLHKCKNAGKRALKKISISLAFFYAIGVRTKRNICINFIKLFIATKKHFSSIKLKFIKLLPFVKQQFNKVFSKKYFENFIKNDTSLKKIDSRKRAYIKKIYNKIKQRIHNIFSFANKLIAVLVIRKKRIISNIQYSKLVWRINFKKSIYLRNISFSLRNIKVRILKIFSFANKRIPVIDSGKKKLINSVLHNSLVGILLLTNFFLLACIISLKNYSPLELFYLKNSLLQNFYVQQENLQTIVFENNNKTLTFIRKTASFIPGNNIYSVESTLNNTTQASNKPSPTTFFNNSKNTLTTSKNANKKSAPSSPAKPTQYGPLKTFAYEMQAGDNYWNISKETGTSLDTLLSFNKIDKAHAVVPGEIIYIPQREGILHEKKTNESLSKVASIYSIEQKKIAFFNPDINAKYYFIPDTSFNLSQRRKLLGNEFFKPIDNIRLTGFFGYRRHPITKSRTIHKGIDFGGAIGTPIYAAKGGSVTIAGTRNGYGLTVVISHGNNTRSLYAHLSSINVKVGQRVMNRQRIGSLGNTGRSTGPHLHFEIHKNNKPVNPLPITELFK